MVSPDGADEWGFAFGRGQVNVCLVLFSEEADEFDVAVVGGSVESGGFGVGG